MSYEVIIITKNKEREQFGKKFEACESYPTDNQWGVRGWTYKTYEEAEKKIQSLTIGKANLPLPKSKVTRTLEERVKVPVL